jgi:glycosyltransferase involved in cell wall biosynthesis
VQRRVCFVGLMVGRHPGHLTSQGLIVADRLAGSGRYAVTTTSSVRNRCMRLVDVAVTLVRGRRRIDIVCIEVYGGLSFVLEDMASALGRLFGHRIVFVAHGGALPSFVARFPRWSRRVLRRADALVTPSAYLQRALRDVTCDARVISNVIDLEAYPFRPRRRLRPRLFWMRSFHPLWNPEMAVRVLARVRAAAPDATLIMAGPDKGCEARVRRLAEQLGVADATAFVGFLDHEGKTRCGMEADIFINTNRIDNMPVAIVEASAMGLPVVSTRVGGIPDLLAHGDTALLVPDDDDAAMAEAVLELLGNEALASRLSEHGRRLAERCAWDRVQHEWDRLFEELVPAPPGATPEYA